jgi:hypothetical protein
MHVDWERYMNSGMQQRLQSTTATSPVSLVEHDVLHGLQPEAGNLCEMVRQAAWCGDYHIRIARQLRKLRLHGVASHLRRMHAEDTF